MARTIAITLLVLIVLGSTLYMAYDTLFHIFMNFTSVGF